MGKLSAIVPRYLFRRKPEETYGITSTVELDSKVERKTPRKCPMRTSNVETPGVINKTVHTNTVIDSQTSNRECEKLIITKEIENILKSLTEDENIEGKIYQLERSFLFHQNNMIENFEEEKHEIMKSFKDENMRLKRAHDYDKLELLREIERKDKMLIELSKVLKREYEKSLKDQQKKIVKSFDEKICVLNEKTNLVLRNIEEIIDNNFVAINNLESFGSIKKEIESFLDSVQSVLSKSIKSSESDAVEDNETSSNKQNFTETFNPLAEEAVSPTAIPGKIFSSRETKNAEQDVTNDEVEIQHEIAQAYRKQKTELMKLFNAEKVEYIKKVEKDKVEFEKHIRMEYESRMFVERKAWQETIEDFEREIAILKFEREHMDRNYCIGIDELKTEFEREKRTLHRSYSETHAELKRSLERKQAIDIYSEEFNLDISHSPPI